jgi:hypothetical protein
MTDSSLSCKVLRLTNGEHIIGYTDDACENLANARSIMFMEPMLLTSIRIPRPSGIAESYIMYPWMPLTDDKVIEINSACIVSVANARPSFREQYEKFVDQINEQTNETEITEVDINRLSTSGSIKDLIEKLTEDLQSDDEEEQDHGNWEPPTRTLH